MFEFFSSKPTTQAPSTRNDGTTKHVLQILVDSATDPVALTEPDWERNLDICDKMMISKNTELAAKQFVRFLTIRLQSPDQKMISLSLVLADCCMKNCGDIIAGAIDQKFMTELILVSSGSGGRENATESTRLISEWNDQFSNNEKYPIFKETFNSLKNCTEIRETENPISIAKQTEIVAQAQADSLGQVDGLSKLEQDYNVVKDQIILCQEMMQQSIGIDKGDLALAKVVGYLEACRDRLVELIEAGTNGLLSEESFSKCLKLYDSIIKTLDAEKNGTAIEISTDLLHSNSTTLEEIPKVDNTAEKSAEVSSSSSSSSSSQPTTAATPAPAAAAAKSNDNWDEHIDDFLKSASQDKNATTNVTTKAVTSSTDDDLDSFLNSLDTTVSSTSPANSQSKDITSAVTADPSAETIDL